MITCTEITQNPIPSLEDFVVKDSPYYTELKMLSVLCRLSKSFWETIYNDENKSRK